MSVEHYDGYVRIQKNGWDVAVFPAWLSAPSVILNLGSGLTLHDADEKVLTLWAAIRDAGRAHLDVCPTVEEVRDAIVEGRAALANHVSDAEQAPEGASS